MVHITDTRAQKVYSCTSEHITVAKQFILSTAVSVYRHSQKHRKLTTIRAVVLFLRTRTP